MIMQMHMILTRRIDIPLKGLRI